jgi:purine-cytosine permease-like protein
MAFSIVANITPNTYSAALSAQTILPIFQKIPRAVWCVFMFVVYTAASIGGRNHLSEVLSNFLAILGCESQWG